MGSALSGVRHGVRCRSGTRDRRCRRRPSRPGTRLCMKAVLQGGSLPRRRRYRGRCRSGRFGLTTCRVPAGVSDQAEVLPAEAYDLGHNDYDQSRLCGGGTSGLRSRAAANSGWLAERWSRIPACRDPTSTWVGRLTRRAPSRPLARRISSIVPISEPSDPLHMDRARTLWRRVTGPRGQARMVAASMSVVRAGAEDQSEYPIIQRVVRATRSIQFPSSIRPRV